MAEIDTRFDTRIGVRPAAGAEDEIDEFDLDLRLGELAGWHPGRPTHLLGDPLVVDDAQTDGAGCLPTGGKGEGGTCNTQDNTCAGTCAGRNTCPQTACGATCPPTGCGNTCITCPRTDCGNTCPRTDCGNTCPRTDCGNTCADFTNCGGTCAGTHCFTCRSGCQEP